jgi:hypothetical protein
MRRREYFCLVKCSVGGDGDAEPACWECLDKHSEKEVSIVLKRANGKKERMRMARRGVDVDSECRRR